MRSISLEYGTSVVSIPGNRSRVDASTSWCIPLLRSTIEKNGNNAISVHPQQALGRMFAFRQVHVEIPIREIRRQHVEIVVHRSHDELRQLSLSRNQLLRRGRLAGLAPERIGGGTLWIEIPQHRGVAARRAQEREVDGSGRLSDTPFDVSDSQDFHLAASLLAGHSPR